LKFRSVLGKKISHFVRAGSLIFVFVAADTVRGAMAVETAMSSISSPGESAPASNPAPSTKDTTVVKEITGGGSGKTVTPMSNSVVNIKELPAIVDIPQTPESVEKEQRYEQEGEALFNRHQLNEALAKWQEAYGLSLEMKYAEGEGRALVNMCRVFLDRGQFVKAKYMGENAIEILSSVHDKRALGRAHLFLAQAYYGLDNSLWAGEQLSLALKEFTADGGNNSIDTANLMALGAAVLVKIGKLRESLQFLESAATFYMQANDVVASMNARTKMIEMLLNLGLYTAASEEADKAVSMAKASGSDKPMLTITSMTAQANCRYSLGEFLQAKKIYEQIFPLIKALPDKTYTKKGLGSLLMGYGSALAGGGEFEQAVPVLERAYNLFKEEGQTLSESQVANTLACAEEELGHHDKARQLLEQALDLQAVIVPKQDSLRCTIATNLAAIEFRMGHARDARVHYETAASLAKAMKSATLLGRIHCGEAEATMKLAEPIEAQRVLKLALKESDDVKDDSALWREYTLQAKLDAETGNAGMVQESLTSALSSFRSPQAGLFPNPERVGYPSSRREAAAQLFSLLSAHKLTEQAFMAVEQEKERSFINEWTNRGGQPRPEDADLYNELASLRVHLHTAESSTAPIKIIDEWRSWATRFKAVSQQNRAVARLIAPIPMSMTEILKGVQKSHATILDYFMGDDSSIIFTINGAGRITATVIPVGHKRIDGQVASFYNALPKGEAANPQAVLNEKRVLQALYAELFPASVRSFLPADPEHMLIVIPDGPLFNLPFGALITEQQKYLVENHMICIAPSVGTIVDMAPRYTDELNGIFAAQQPQGDEASALSSAFSPGAVLKLLGKDAMDARAVVDQSRGKAVLQLADRFTFSNSEPFAAESSADSKKLTPDKLLGQSIPNDLLVFSGSAVNPKDILGSSVRLSSRGLSYEGTRNLLMGLWPQASDDRTSELSEFYKNLQLGLNQADSLRKAQLMSLSKDNAPHSWASMQLLGAGY